MAAVYQIPLQPSTPQTLGITLAGVAYNLRVYYADTGQPDGVPVPSATAGGWLLDINDASGNPILCGRPLLPGTDILNQFRYLGFNGGLYVQDSANWTDVPTFKSLGGPGTSQLYFVTTP